MQIEGNKSVYLDVGTSKVTTTLLIDNPKYLTDDKEGRKTPITYTFPSCMLSDVETCLTPKNIFEEIEKVTVRVFNEGIENDKEQKGSIEGLGVANSKESKGALPDLKFNQLVGQQLKLEDQLHILRLVYNAILIDKKDKKKAGQLPVILTEKLNVSMPDRARLIEYLFEKLRVPSLFLTSTPVLTLLSQYQETGVVVELAESTTHIVCVKQGYALRTGLQDYGKAGKDVTHEFVQKVIANDFLSQPPLHRLLLTYLRDGSCKFEEIKSLLPDAQYTDHFLPDSVNETYLPSNSEGIITSIQHCISNTIQHIGLDLHSQIIFVDFFMASKFTSI